MSEWKDVTSHSQGDKERVPKTFEIRLGFIRVVVTRHIYFSPDVWTYRCDGLGDQTNFELQNRDLEGAKKEALERIKPRLEKALDALQKALE